MAPLNSLSRSQLALTPPRFSLSPRFTTHATLSQLCYIRIRYLRCLNGSSIISMGRVWWHRWLAVLRFHLFDFLQVIRLNFFADQKKHTCQYLKTKRGRPASTLVHSRPFLLRYITREQSMAGPYFWVDFHQLWYRTYFR